MSKIESISGEPAIDLSLDTIKIGRQALVFCNTRISTEATAEKITKEIKTQNHELETLSEEILHVLSSPTKQCRRLAYCVKKGTAFHHAGLAAGQRKLVEDNFKKGILKIICSTPTLAMGINLPAFRAIIKDLKRYGGRWGLQYIPTLEYHQMAGRAGRPDFNDEFGEAICIASSEKDAEEIVERFLHAPPENIYSKLAVEPVLRTYCLSLISIGYAKSRQELLDFFSKTFYGHQYGDLEQLGYIIDKMLKLLSEWGFIDDTKDDFVSANEMGSEILKPTPIGQRVAELYLDPYTAFQIITALRRATQKKVDETSFMQLASSTLEVRPLPSIRVREMDMVEAALSELNDSLITFEPSVFDPEYDEFLKTIKLTLALDAWMDEKNEDEILEDFNIAPGELHYKKELCDWILYASEELAMLLNFRDLVNLIKKTRFRLDKGVKEELVPLVRIKNIGRVRARLLYRNNIKDVGDIKKAPLQTLIQLLGQKTALNLKEQVGEKVEKIGKTKRKGQTSIEKY